MASDPRPIPKNQLDLLDMLSQYGVRPEDRKAPTSVARFPTARSQSDLQQMLSKWNANPQAFNVPTPAPVAPPQPKAESGGLLNGLLNIAGKVASNPVAKVVGTALNYGVVKPWQTVDTGRRAVISGLREFADVVDSSSDTTASWDDFFKQAKDKDTGFGNTFTLKGKWRGRIIGFWVMSY